MVVIGSADLSSAVWDHAFWDFGERASREPRFPVVESGGRDCRDKFLYRVQYDAWQR